ncbi:MAG: PduL/EutD family phosphate acyltransferase [Candidatus Uhrbacteria bacterium]|nr:PduL/EutD family phosphate acyltransferase [Candidatus Uhrbacteria bacterium]
MFIPLVIQHRHVHLSKKDLRQLFGDEKTLEIESELEHKGQYLYRETVDVEGKTGIIESVRVLGPSRSATQVELSITDAFAIGLNAPTRQSGDLTRAASCKLIGPAGSVRATSSVIVPARHLHCSDRMAKKLHVKNHHVVTLRHAENPDVVLSHVFVRVHPTFALELHLTSDEAAHHWLHTGDLFELC